MFHLPYIDVYFNPPISKIVHTYISHVGEKQGKSHFGQNQISQNSERYNDGA